MIQLIAFDMDGTLTDSRGIITAYINRTLAHYGRPPLPAGRILKHVGYGARALLEGVMQEASLQADPEELFRYYDALYRADPSYQVEPYPKIPEMLAELGARGIRRAVLSNRPHQQTLLITGAVLNGCLDEVYGQRAGIPMKPDPAGLRLLLRENGCPESGCLYVGDMHYDVEAARAAGVRSVGCSWGIGGFSQVESADFVISHPLELLDIVDQLNRGRSAL
ncbi:MAG: hypothetical protein DBX52_02075 [Clostridiales bacterium]|nr:MAG: hypothetical protein DBX52_02075 [Clostridiales bacterium]